MQEKLKDILSNPPHGLGTVANILLLMSLVLLLSIFFMDPKEEHDVMLNVDYNKNPIAEDNTSQNQLSNASYDSLFTVAEVGQTVESGDTIFRTIREADILSLNRWRALIKNGKSLPLHQMLASPIINDPVKVKLRALAKAQAPPKKIYTKRIQELETRVSELRKSVEEYSEAIKIYDAYKIEFRDSFYSARERYNDDELSLAELESKKDKWDEYVSIANQKQKQYQAEKKYFEEEKSELESLKRAQSVEGRIKGKTDYRSLEVDLAIALDSVHQASAVLAAYDGELESIGDLHNVAIRDVLATFAGEEIKNHKSKRLVAEARNLKDARRVFPGRALFIYLKDGSIVKGEIKSKIKGSNEMSEGQFEIYSNEELSVVDVDQIILPSKKENFIEKVLDNF